jgi:hypothetical protein
MRWLPLLLLLLASAASALRLEDTFAEANDAAIRGDHAEAQRGYEALEEAGVLDADVAFDLATVHAQQGHYGEAIRYFERTLALRPGDPDAKKGLVDARRVLADRLAAEEGEVELTEHSSLGQALVRDLGEGALAWTFVVVWLALFVAVAGWRLLRGRARLVSAVATVLLLAAVVGDGLLLATKRGVFREGAAGIVVSGRARVLEGPDPRARTRHRLLEGQRVEVVGREPGYLRVRGPKGERGWVLDGEVGLVLPPDA